MVGSITVTVPLNAEGANTLAVLAQRLGSLDKVKTVEVPKAAKIDFEEVEQNTKSKSATKREEIQKAPEAKKRHRRTKAEIEAAEMKKELEDEADLTTDDLPEIEETIIEPSRMKKKSLTLEGDIIPAFRTYAQTNGGDEARNFLIGLKVKSIRDLPETRYPEVLQALNS